MLSILNFAFACAFIGVAIVIFTEIIKDLQDV